jgi:hypothetical protein
VCLGAAVRRNLASSSLMCCYQHLSSSFLYPGGGYTQTHIYIICIYIYIFMFSSGQMKGEMANTMLSVWDIKANQPGANLRAGRVAGTRESARALSLARAQERERARERARQRERD